MTINSMPNDQDDQEIGPEPDTRTVVTISSGTQARTGTARARNRKHAQIFFALLLIFLLPSTLLPLLFLLLLHLNILSHANIACFYECVFRCPFFVYLIFFFYRGISFFFAILIQHFFFSNAVSSCYNHTLPYRDRLVPRVATLTAWYNPRIPGLPLNR